jgi:hypothetical protein
VANDDPAEHLASPGAIDPFVLGRSAFGAETGGWEADVTALRAALQSQLALAAAFPERLRFRVEDRKRLGVGHIHSFLNTTNS